MRSYISGILQVAPMCPPIWPHWRHLANMIELMLPSAHPSAQPKRQIDWFSRFCTAHGRKLYFTIGNPFPQIAHSHGDLDPISHTISWAHPGPQTNGVSIGSAVFAGLISVTERQTDRPTNRPRYSVAKCNRPHQRTQYCDAT